MICVRWCHVIENLPVVNPMPYHSPVFLHQTTDIATDFDFHFEWDAFSLESWHAMTTLARFDSNIPLGPWALVAVDFNSDGKHNAKTMHSFKKSPGSLRSSFPLVWPPFMNEMFSFIGHLIRPKLLNPGWFVMCNFYGVAGVPDAWYIQASYITSHKSKSESKSSKSRVKSQELRVRVEQHYSLTWFNGVIATLCSNLSDL